MSENTNSARRYRLSIWLSIVVLAVGAFGTWMFLSGQNHLDEAASIDSTMAEDVVSANGSDRAADATVTQSKVETSANVLSAENSALSVESEEWYRSRGYYIDLSAPTGIVQPTHPYQGYSDQTLEQLVDSGDMVAAAILGDRLLAKNNEENRQKGLSLHKEAVVLGSTYSAVILGGENLHRGMSGDAQSDFAKIRDGLAWYLYASHRGDAAGDYNFQQYVSSRNVTAAMINTACTQAKSLRVEFDAERRSRGLGEFDDSPFPQLSELENQGFMHVEVCD